MENNKQDEVLNYMDGNRKNDRFGRIAGGLILVGAGVALFARKSGVWFPEWIFSFEMFLIVLGAFIWARHSFKRSGGLILMLIGGFFLLDDVIPTFHIGHYFWPIVIIGIGLWVMFAPTGRKDDFKKKFKNRKQFGNFTNPDQPQEASLDSDGIIDSTTVFGAIKKNIYSKDFKGGKADTFFGGTEINLSHADLTSPAILEITQVFGGTKLIIPPHWQIKSELVAVLGGVEDKRPIHPQQQESNKLIILRGTTIFGGIDIKSY
jgi:predicted membrane protein